MKARLYRGDKAPLNQDGVSPMRFATSFGVRDSAERIASTGLRVDFGPTEIKTAPFGAVGFVGAGDGIRTREYQLGKLGPYHLATPAHEKMLGGL